MENEITILNDEIKKLKHQIFKILSIQQYILEFLDKNEKQALINKILTEYK